MKINSFRRFVLRFPFHIKQLFGVVWICALMTGFSGFVRASDDIQQADDKDVRQLIKQAEKETKKGNLVEAEKILRRVIVLSPQETKAKLNLSYVLLKQRRFVEAYDLSIAVARDEPKNSFAFAVLGATLLSAGNFKEAKLSFYNALTLDRRESLAWAGIGMLDFYENRIQDGLENLRAAVFYDPDEPDYVFALAQVAARSEEYKEAAENYKRFLQISPDTDKERRDRIKGLINFLNFLGGKQRLYSLGGKEQTTVPVNLVNNRPIIKLRVNKKDEVLNFVLDTGSGISVISQKTAERLKIKPITRGGLARAIGGDGKFEIVYGFLKVVDIGDVRIRDVPVYIRQFHGNNEEIDGYIGLSLISKFLTTIDYGKLTFSLLRKKSDQKLNLDNEALSLPLRLTSSGFLSGEVQLEGVEAPLNFIVDTGASISVISDELAGEEKINKFIREEKMRVVGAAGVTEDVPSFLLPRVTFGNHSRESITAIALDLDIINEASGFEQAGILGGNFLRNYSLTFDFQNSKVIFIPIGK